MTDVVVVCPNCGRELEMTERRARAPLSCPACAHRIEFPLGLTRFWNFDCPACGQNLELDAAYGGSEVDCPKCAARLRAPSAGQEVELLSRPAVADIRGQTTRIEVPPEWAIPPPKPKSFTIKRPEGRS